MATRPTTSLLAGSPGVDGIQRWRRDDFGTSEDGPLTGVGGSGRSTPKRPRGLT